MQYKCEVCHDSGSKNQTGDYLDCPACDMPVIRKALNEFVKSLGPTHPEDVALAIHQRALAMAPKKEADHINDVVKMVAPAGWKLVPEDPTGDMFRAAAKIDNEMFAGGSSHGAEDGQIWAAMYDAAPEAPVAAPAAANGAPPELPEPETMIVESDLGHRAYTADQMRAYGQACAAAGLDAALVKALQTILKSAGEVEDLPIEGMWLSDFCRAALSGAKGN